MLHVRLKRPAQPLVFQFQRAGSLCAAVACLYQAWPKLEASLCLYRGAYYLKAAAAAGGALRQAPGSLPRVLRLLRGARPVPLHQRGGGAGRGPLGKVRQNPVPVMKAPL